jgi:hypothetical protein
MKTLGILAAVLILGLLALGFSRGLHLNLTGAAESRGATFSLRTPETASATLELTAQEQRAMTDALAPHGRRIASARLHAERTPPARHRADQDTAWAAFSLELTLDDGATLASSLRQVPRQRLGAALAECVADCMRAYEAQKALGRDVRTLGNI